MIEVAALLAAFLEATGRGAAIWERREGASPALLGTSSATFASRTEAGVGARDTIAWAQSPGLHAQLVTTGKTVGWLLV